MKITDSEVAHVARLARLRLDIDEVKHFQKDLNAILEYMEMLSGIDTTGTTPTVHTTTMVNAMRPDSVEASQEPEDALLNAPRQNNGTIVVPKVIE